MARAEHLAGTDSSRDPLRPAAPTDTSAGRLPAGPAEHCQVSKHIKCGAGLTDQNGHRIEATLAIYQQAATCTRQSAPAGLLYVAADAMHTHSTTSANKWISWKPRLQC